MPLAPTTSKTKTAKKTTADGLKVPQARCLKALMPKPEARDAHFTEWPSLCRTDLASKAGFNPTTGTINRVLHGIPQGSSSGEPHPGLLERGLMKATDLDIDGVAETQYRITAAGIRAYERHVAEHGDRLPKRRDKALCVNDRYQE